MGLSRTASLIAAVRAEATNSMLVFPSGPKAKDHPAEVSGIEFAGEGENGFANFRIKL